MYNLHVTWHSFYSEEMCSYVAFSLPEKCAGRGETAQVLPLILKSFITNRNKLHIHMYTHVCRGQLTSVFSPNFIHGYSPKEKRWFQPLSFLTGLQRTGPWMNCSSHHVWPTFSHNAAFADLSDRPFSQHTFDSSQRETHRWKTSLLTMVPFCKPANQEGEPHQHPATSSPAVRALVINIIYHTVTLLPWHIKLSAVTEV